MKKRARRLRSEERREQILRSAIAVFARANYRATRISDIAAEAGVSEAMIYKHFPSKRSIFLEILEHKSARILEVWKREVQKEPDALEALRRLVLAYYRTAKEHPDELKIHWRAISEIGDRTIRARLRKDYQGFIRFVTSVIEKGIRQGVIRKGVDVEAMAFLYTGGGIVVNTMILLALDKQFDERLLPRVSDHLLGMLEA